MNIKELAKKIDASVIVDIDLTRDISTGYAGDFLSFVMGKAPANSAWFTVMANVNVCAVASLTDVAVVVICENVEPDQYLVQKAKDNNVNIIKTKLDVFNAIKAFCE